jgi:hypothetical protein
VPLLGLFGVEPVHRALDTAPERTDRLLRGPRQDTGLDRARRGVVEVAERLGQHPGMNQRDRPVPHQCKGVREPLHEFGGGVQPGRRRAGGDLQRAGDLFADEFLAERLTRIDRVGGHRREQLDLLVVHPGPQPLQRGQRIDAPLG